MLLNISLTEEKIKELIEKFIISYKAEDSQKLIRSQKSDLEKNN